MCFFSITNGSCRCLGLIGISSSSSCCCMCVSVWVCVGVGVGVCVVQQQSFYCVPCQKDTVQSLIASLLKTSRVSDGIRGQERKGTRDGMKETRLICAGGRRSKCCRISGASSERGSAERGGQSVLSC